MLLPPPRIELKIPEAVLGTIDAVLKPPPPTKEPTPLAVFLIPPPTVDQSPEATFLLPAVPASPPPPIKEYEPVA